jgi:hypothetical protein
VLCRYAETVEKSCRIPIAVIQPIPKRSQTARLDEACGERGLSSAWPPADPYDATVAGSVEDLKQPIEGMDPRQLWHRDFRK